MDKKNKNNIDTKTKRDYEDYEDDRDVRDVRVTSLLWPHFPADNSEWKGRATSSTEDEICKVLSLCFDTSSYDLKQYTIIKNTTDAIKACMQLLNYKYVLCNHEDIPQDTRQMSRTPQKVYVSTRCQRINDVSKKITNDIKTELKELFEDNFDPKKLDAVQCLEYEMHEIETLCNHPRTKDIFKAFNVKLKTTNFFDYLFYNEDFNWMFENIQLLQNSDFFKNKGYWTDEKKHEYMSYLGYIKPRLLKQIYAKYEITPEKLEKILIYLCSLEKLVDYTDKDGKTRKKTQTMSMSDEKLSHFLKKRETPLTLAKRPYHRR